MVYRFAVPAATQTQLQSQVTGWSSCRNLGLLLHQYVPREVIQSGGREKGQWLAQLAQRTRPRAASPLFDHTLHEEWVQRWTQLADAHQAIRFDAKCSWRMVVGLGGQSPAETDLLVHSVYGIPYVPGSALKGLARAYVQLEGLGDSASSHPSESAAVPAEVERIFGVQERSGSVVFLDAIPKPGLRLDVDVMNPHYPEYYRDATGRHPPSNDQNPVPVHFLAVSTDSTFNSTFCFAVAPRAPSGTREDVRLASDWLWHALRDYGIGAKTSAGYGRFQDPDMGGN